MKELYSFEVSIKETVIKKIEEEKRKKNKETGKFEKIKVEVEKEVEEEDLYKFIIKKPTRKDVKDADIFYSVKLNGYIKQGILTQKQVFNTYVNNGGILSDAENEEAFEALVELNNVKSELHKLSVDGALETDGEKKEEIQEKLIKKQRYLYDMLYDIELQKDAIFSNSADNMARNDLIEWWILRLIHFKKDEESEEYKPFFNGEDYSQKYDNLCELEDSENELYNEMIKTAAPVVTIWSMSGTESQEEIESALKGDV
ncbi:MAG: hypothetical protein ACW99F_00305 [Candidatus Hodarchaeales archaeon]|jgi:hypothetical protein